VRTANQLTFASYEALLKIRLNDPTKVIFDNIDWPFIRPLVCHKYSSQGADGNDPIFLSKPSSSSICRG
jgi:hypothetical protein